MYKSGVKQASTKLIIEMEATSKYKYKKPERKGLLFDNCTKDIFTKLHILKEVMLIRTSTAQILELILREHEQSIKSMLIKIHLKSPKVYLSQKCDKPALD